MPRHIIEVKEGTSFLLLTSKPSSANRDVKNLKAASSDGKPT